MVGLGRLYTVSFAAVSFTAANGDHDYFELVPATNKLIVIEAIYVKAISELGDAQEEWVRWEVVRGNTTSGSGGAAPTPAPQLSSDAAAGFTAETANTTPATTAGTIVHEDAWNVRMGLEYVPIPEHRIPCSAADSRICVRQPAALADDATLSGTIYVREF